MKTLKPIIQTEEPDKYGRTVKVGLKDGTVTSYFQTMSVEEATQLRDELTAYLNSVGGNYLRDRIAAIKKSRDIHIGDTVKVRFEEFAMPDKHIPGRCVHPKRIYRHVKIEEKRGPHLSGTDLGEGKVRKFHVEQIVEVL